MQKHRQKEADKYILDFPILKMVHITPTNMFALG